MIVSSLVKNLNCRTSNTDSFTKSIPSFCQSPYRHVYFIDFHVWYTNTTSLPNAWIDCEENMQPKICRKSHFWTSNPKWHPVLNENGRWRYTLHMCTENTWLILYTICYENRRNTRTVSSVGASLVCEILEGLQIIYCTCETMLRNHRYKKCV